MVYPFFDMDILTQILANAYDLIGTDGPIIVSDFNMSIRNSNHEIVQDSPFAVLYNPEFP